LRDKLRSAAEKVIAGYIHKNATQFNNLEFSEKAIEIALGDGVSVAGRIDLKLNGTVPFVDAARIWALDLGLKETNTSARLNALAAGGRLPIEDVRGWVAAFEFLQLLRLRVQHARATSASDEQETNPNAVEVSSLSTLDRRIVNESLRQGRKILQHLALDFPA